MSPTFRRISSENLPKSKFLDFDLATNFSKKFAHNAGNRVSEDNEISLLDIYTNYRFVKTQGKASFLR